jgi:hypothetical protein
VKGGEGREEAVLRTFFERGGYELADGGVVLGRGVAI